VRGFDEARWAAVRFALVVAGNRAKFEQNADLLAHLLATGDAILVEASPEDAVWGLGLAVAEARKRGPRNWPGQNLLGFALIEVRASLRG
jgi:ribA/ribD-fused uncharacterized protein